MKIITPGHKYELENFEPVTPTAKVMLLRHEEFRSGAYEITIMVENLPKGMTEIISKVAVENLQAAYDKEGCQTLQFIEKMPVNQNPEKVNFGLETVNNGTTNEEVLAVLIDRLQFLNGKFPCRENSIALTKLDEALLWLNKRTADRKARGVEGKHVK